MTHDLRKPVISITGTVLEVETFSGRTGFWVALVFSKVGTIMKAVYSGASAQRVLDAQIKSGSILTVVGSHISCFDNGIKMFCDSDPIVVSIN